MTQTAWQLCTLSLLAVSAAAQDMSLSSESTLQSTDVGHIVYVHPLARLRLDFDWSAFNHQQEDGVLTDGVGTIQIGGKAERKKGQYHKFAPGVSQYEAELPTASAGTLQGCLYHQFSEAFGGVRIGASDRSATIGTTIGLVFGRRLQHDGVPSIACKEVSSHQNITVNNWNAGGLI